MNQVKPQLKLDWCSHEAAKYAVEHWHYSQAMVGFKTVKIGVWEDSKFIGAIIFSWGANRNIGSPYGLEQNEVCELVRVALNKHVTPVSRIGAIALKMLKTQSPGLRLIVSYADIEQGHHGGIYQAMGWVYSGISGTSEKVFYKGKWVHKRTVDAIFGNHKGFRSKPTLGKHTYLMSLDADMKEKIKPLAKPYPKRAGSVDSDTTNDQLEKGGANPTPALHTETTIA